MGQQAIFDNYTAVGDLTVIATCMVVAVLLATSYVTRTRTFRLFLNMLIYLALAAFVDVIMHDFYTHITDGRYTAIYVLKIIYHILLFSLLLLYIVYFVVVLQLDRKTRRPLMVLATVIYMIVLINDVVSTIRKSGFRLDGSGEAVSAFNIFVIGYVSLLSILGYLMVKYRNRVYKKALYGVIGTAAVSLLILFNQAKHGQSSFTVVSFMFPMIALMYLLHSSPYDIKTGTINASAFSDAVSYNYLKKRTFYLINLYLPGYSSEGKPLPKDLEAVIRAFPSRHFKKTVLFHIGNGDMLLMISAKANPDCEEKMQDVINDFFKEYEIFNVDYKLIIGKSIDEISARNEYLSFIKDMRRNMPLNSLHIVSEKDVALFNKSEVIIKELEDINRKQDIEDERVLVYCQPVFNIMTGKYDTAEALMRLELPGLGMVYPDQFIPLAEEYDYIHMLTKIILHKTCMSIKDLTDNGYDVKRISVNVSMPELRDEGFTDDIEGIINASKIPSGKIAIEITESQTESDFLLVKKMIDRLKGAGIKFYLDDFGTGYSNMERIMKLPFDIIKFDRSLVLACQSDSRSQEIVGRLASMFADLDYSVLYEGVEDEADEKRCISMSASYLQGYKYSKPVPIDELKNFFCKTA